VPPAPGLYEFTAHTVYPGDGDASNDSLTIRIYLLDSAAADEPLALGPRMLSVQPNPVRSSAVISLLVPAGQAGRLELFAPDGRRVAGWIVEPGDSRVARFPWNGRDAGGREVPSGLYLVRGDFGGTVAGGKFIRWGK
jgi:hypothetical protein